MLHKRYTNRLLATRSSGPALGRMDRFDAIGPCAQRGFARLQFLKLRCVIQHGTLGLIIYLNFENFTEDCAEQIRGERFGLTFFLIKQLVRLTDCVTKCK